MSSAKVTVGIPCRNEVTHIEECLSSVFQQKTNFDYNIIISDNNSTDGTLELIEKVISTEKKAGCTVTFFRSDADAGALTNFRKVFDACDTPYFMWLGAHDYLSLDLLEKCVKVLDENNDCALAGAIPYGVFPVDSCHENVVRKKLDDAVYDFSQSDRLLRYLKSIGQLSNCTVFHSVFRRSLLDGFNWRSCPSCDHLVISRLLWYGKLKYAQAQYSRRYFDEKDRKKKAANGNYEKNSYFFDSYLEDFHILASEHMSEHLVTSLKNLVFNILYKRFGVPKLVLSDCASVGNPARK